MQYPYHLTEVAMYQLVPKKGCVPTVPENLIGPAEAVEYLPLDGVSDNIGSAFKEGR